MGRTYLDRSATQRGLLTVPRFAPNIELSHSGLPARTYLAAPLTGILCCDSCDKALELSMVSWYTLGISMLELLDVPGGCRPTIDQAAFEAAEECGPGAFRGYG